MPLLDRWSDATLRRAARVVAATWLVGAAIAIAMLVVVAGETRIMTASYAALVVGTTWPLAGAVVLQAEPRNACGWLLLASGLLIASELVGMYAQWGRVVLDAPLPGQTFAEWVATWAFTQYMFVVPLLTLCFPDGRLPSPRYRPFVWSLLVSAVLLTLGSMVVDRFPTPSFFGITNPWAVDGGLRSVADGVVAVTMVYSTVIGTAVPVWALAHRRDAVGGRVPTWTLLGAPILLLGLLGGLTVADVPWSREAFTVALLGPPIGIAVGIVRHRWYEVEFVLRRSIVLVVVVAVIGGAWAAVVLAIDTQRLGSGWGAAVIGVLALAAVGLRGLVQDVVDRWFFPHRRGSATLAPRIAAAVAQAAEPREALDELVVALRTELRLPYAGFAGAVAVHDGVRPERVERMPARALGREVGTLEVAPRVKAEPFTHDERVLLEQVAAQAAVLAHAAGLMGEVEQSRAGIVRSREEERRRLRNDLHDGVGPTLAAIALQADALASRMDGADGSDQAGAIRDRLREAVAQVRAVSHGLRPPILDQIGLSAALRQLAEGLTGISGTAQVDDLDGLPAASEVAAYVIASEAVTNAVKHSAASSIRVDAERSPDRLVVRVIDNGRGMPPRPEAGVGLTSMRQRASEVGGRLEHRAVPDGGTAVVLTLPIREDRS